MIISFLFASLFLFIFNLISQIFACSYDIRELGKISATTMATIVLGLILITWNIFAIIVYFN